MRKENGRTLFSPGSMAWMSSFTRTQKPFGTDATCWGLQAAHCDGITERAYVGGNNVYIYIYIYVVATRSQRP